jgi:hypothetical protein
MPNIEPIIGAAVKGARKIAGIMGAGAKDVNPTYRMGVSEAKANARGLKAANKPTQASKTFIGSNKNLSPSVRRDIIVNQTKPARPNRERGGTLKTLRAQGKTNPTPTKSQKDDMLHDIRIKQEKVSEKQLKEHYRSMYKQWND